MGIGPHSSFVSFSTTNYAPTHQMLATPLLADLSEAGAGEIDVENAEEAVVRLADERAPAVGADGQRARRVRGREAGERARSSASAGGGRVDVVGRRLRDGEQSRLGRLADQDVPRVRTEDADDVRPGLDELVERRQQDAAVDVHCDDKHTDRLTAPRKLTEPSALHCVR